MGPRNGEEVKVCQMNPKMVWAVSLIFLAGCVGVDQSAFDKPPMDPRFKTIIQNPYFAKIKAETFQDLKIPYRQAGDYAQLTFGPQMITALIIKRPSYFKFDKLALSSFTGTCEPSGSFLPKLKCDVKYSFLIETDGIEKNISGRVVHQEDRIYLATGASTLRTSTSTELVRIMYAQVEPIAFKIADQVYKKKN